MSINPGLGQEFTRGTMTDDTTCVNLICFSFIFAGLN